MKRVLFWMGKVLGKVVATVLVIVLLPYASKLAAAMLPDLSGAAINTSVTLSQRLSASARLECNQVDAEGVLDATTTALLIGTVQSVQIAYRYHASIGIDLAKVGIHINDSEITFVLPEMEVLSDSLTPTQISRNDFWYPLTDERRQKLLDDEQAACRAKYLAETAASEEGWANVISAFEGTVSQWMARGNARITFRYEHP